MNLNESKNVGKFHDILEERLNQSSHLISENSKSESLYSVNFSEHSLEEPTLNFEI
jgi:hypothetical protein